ncbi:MAG: UDP-N-acetylglucosamine--N-acetylmuramyl-(pentapeptide) pyrophosphoryl-undecaprenol N-acetylglucosamine transferase [Patescibacteria group bacterium]|nr:UDP-N-acetylglucosamine--N-acetylmuramyl-(pentapeptide) pyrophosphoryl-undecaprenol N-acetylglucosamine transferase [Patescibacteria group bacterium]
MTSKIKILLTGGGSGGHVYPLIAVSQALKTLAAEKGVSLELGYVGSYGGYRAVLENNDIRVYKILSSKLRRYFSLSNLIEFPKFVLGFVQALGRISTFAPDVVFSKGGPGALPVVLAASFLKIPIVIHESDSIPGLTSAITARFAEKVAVSFASSEKYFPGKTVLTGNPIRKELLQAVEGKTTEECKKLLGLSSSLPLILFIGGSQGAVGINNLVLNNIEKLTKKYQVLHQTGKANYDEVSEKLSSKIETNGALKDRYKPVPYFDEDMPIALCGADLIVSRAGAGSVFEIASFGKPSILISFSRLVQNHQLSNAKEYEESGATLVMEKKELDSDGFISAIDGIMSDSGKREKMSEAALHFLKPNADIEIAKLIYSLLLPRKDFR